MVIDVHVHIAAATAGRGSMSGRLLRMPAFRFMQWRWGLGGATAESERRLRERTLETINGTPELDKVVLLAFDAVYDREGRRDEGNTHLYVTNHCCPR